MSRAEISKQNRTLIKWVEDVAAKLKPRRTIWCDGSAPEYLSLVLQLCENGSLIELNQQTAPGCYLHRSDPSDVARTEDRTFICSETKAEAGPTNNWMSPEEAKTTLWKLFEGCMNGRTMYVVPYIMGPVNSPFSQIGVEITDSPYVVISLKIMTRMGKIALDQLGDAKEFVKGIHSAGNLDPNQKYICHFPEEKLIMSINSSYGGNALLSKKCHALRIASSVARREGWMSEHMLILGVEDPEGNLFYLTGAFPSASGKTNLANIRQPARFHDWKVWTLGDDIAWLHLDEAGRLRAINPEAGFFGVAPGTSIKSNPNVMQAISRNTLFTNVAMTPGKMPWWEGLTEEAPLDLVDWRGRPWTAELGPAAHPNSRFTAPLAQSPNLSPLWQDPSGVPVSAMLFGGRRANSIPLVFEAFNWTHGVLMGAMMTVETTAAATGRVGILRHDPMAMLPFCGYNMADYFRHWLEIGDRSKNPPRIFYVNWFRRNADGKFLWPGFSENFRVLKWIIERTRGQADAVKTPIGFVPTPESLDLEDINISKRNLEELLHVDGNAWLETELESSTEFFKVFGARFPKRLLDELGSLRERLLHMP